MPPTTQRRLPRPSYTYQNARLFFKNFKGEAKRYNLEGQRNFCLGLEEDEAQRLKADGWNIKWLKPLEDGVPGQAVVEVKVHFGGKPPKIILISNEGKNRTTLKAETVAIMDAATFTKVDLIIVGNPRVEDDGSIKYKGYLDTMYATLYENELDKLYAETPGDAAVDEPPFDADPPY